ICHSIRSHRGASHSAFRAKLKRVYIARQISGPPRGPGLVEIPYIAVVPNHVTAEERATGCAAGPEYKPRIAGAVPHGKHVAAGLLNRYRRQIAGGVANSPPRNLA